MRQHRAAGDPPHKTGDDGEKRPSLSRAARPGDDGEEALVSEKGRWYQTVATGVAGEPTAPGNRKGGPVNRNRLLPFARSQSASSVR